MKKQKVLMASAEVAPFAKVGGLADVVNSLPPAMKKIGVDVRIIMPKYGLIDAKKFGLKKIHSNIEVPSTGKFVKINIWEARLPKTTVKVYFIDCEKYFGAKDVYGNGDNAPRFLFFTQSIVYALPIIGFKPDTIHAHDYHTGMIKNVVDNSGFDYYDGVKIAYTIHNLNYQGKTALKTLRVANLEKKDVNLVGRKKGKEINFMAEGIISAGQVNTVSPTYSKEIMTKEFGAGLENLLRKNKKKLRGVINGIDMGAFDPKKDKHVVKKFDAGSLDKKLDNKLLLQSELGLTIDKNIPIVGLISRLAPQKGLELITAELLKLDCQFVFLGTGQDKYEKKLSTFAKKYPEKVSALMMFDVALAQRIYASSDMFLMPSRYEPCGLGQLIAMRYGTVPVVRSTGGLADTIDENNGFSFKSMSAAALKRTLTKAVKMYREEPKKWQKLQRNGMKRDSSWNKSAKEYLRMYKEIDNV